MGDEMNPCLEARRGHGARQRDARDGERVLRARNRPDVLFEQLASDDQLFPYYRVSMPG